jgi:signal transduction histidine kinase
MIISLRTRLLVGIIVATALLLSVFCVLVYTITRHTLIQHFDTSLLKTARMLSAVIEIEEPEDNEIDFEFDIRMTPEFNTVNGGGYYQIWDPDGNSLVRSPSLGEQTLEPLRNNSEALEYREIILRDQTRVRAVSYRFFPRTDDEYRQNRLQKDPTLHLVLARRADELYGHLEFLKWLLAGASAGVVLLSTGAAWLVTRTGLSPVHSLAAAITSVREDNLGLEFSSEHYPAELAPICQCLNDVFCRLEKSFKREKQFNANVAHELRTPLAGIQSTIEVCLSRAREPAEYRSALEGCLQIAMAMNKMIDTLLTLSKLDSGQMVIEQVPVHLKALVDETWRYFADQAHDKDIGFENAIVPEAICRSDKDRLGMILSNLLENAVEYTNDGGRIWTGLQQSDNQTVVSLYNTGCTLTQDDAEHVFDFFWRKDTARSAAGQHCGIGLSVVRKIASVLDIAMKVEIQGEVFAIHLTIPD